MPAKNCNNCSYCKSIAAVEVTGDEHAIKREFERIERASAKKTKSDTQAKTPSVRADGVQVFLQSYKLKLLKESYNEYSNFANK